MRRTTQHWQLVKREKGEKGKVGRTSETWIWSWWWVTTWLELVDHVLPLTHCYCTVTHTGVHHMPRAPPSSHSCPLPRGPRLNKTCTVHVWEREWESESLVSPVNLWMNWYFSLFMTVWFFQSYTAVYWLHVTGAIARLANENKNIESGSMLCYLVSQIHARGGRLLLYNMKAAFLLREDKITAVFSVLFSQDFEYYKRSCCLLASPPH